MTTYRWGVEFRSASKTFGHDRWFTWAGAAPRLFWNRREAREYIAAHWGDLKTRPDLRAEPHGWRMPRAVRVAVTLREVGAKKVRAK